MHLVEQIHSSTFCVAHGVHTMNKNGHGTTHLGWPIILLILLGIVFTTITKHMVVHYRSIHYILAHTCGFLTMREVAVVPIFWQHMILSS